MMATWVRMRSLRFSFESGRRLAARRTDLNGQQLQVLEQLEHVSPLARLCMKTRLPSYSLYGEQGRIAEIEWLHCESIAERSRLHDWEIRPHRHELLYQILFIKKGKAVLALESDRTSVRGPSVVLVPALAVHGFHFSSDVDGVACTGDRRGPVAPVAGPRPAPFGHERNARTALRASTRPRAALSWPGGDAFSRASGAVALRHRAYTNRSVKLIAFDLGFTDAGYFTRFFKRRTGSAPNAWRAAAAAA
jgi:AraC-like DNA-binding protein